MLNCVPDVQAIMAILQPSFPTSNLYIVSMTQLHSHPSIQKYFPMQVITSLDACQMVSWPPCSTASPPTGHLCISGMVLVQYHPYTGFLSHAGGYFFGCMPDGKAIMATLQPSFPSYQGPLLQILAEWKGTPQPFGSAYSMAIGDTVTQGMIRDSILSCWCCCCCANLCNPRRLV